MTDSTSAWALDDYLADTRLRGRATGTRDRYREVLEDLQRHAGVDLLAVTRSDVRQWLSGRERNGAAFHLRHVKPFFNWAVREGLVGQSPCAGITITPTVDPQLTASDEQVKAMLDACRGRDAVRDRALLTLLTSTGARRGEIGSMTLEDAALYLDSGMVRISKSKTTPRIVPVTAEAEAALRKWLRTRRPARHGGDNLWCVADGGQLVGKVVHRRSGGTLTPHSLRRWFAANWLRRGGSETSLMRVCGWSTSAMISRYTAAVGDDVARDEYRRLWT